jgi:DNA (cytosine-5)-methyltransferase 1
MRPRLLDLFCGAGGAAAGYHRAGFDVVGVDIRPQPRYPFEFHQGDALELLRDWADYSYFRNGVAAIHASPPCQRYVRSGMFDRGNHPDLLPPVRRLLKRTGLPWIIENVPGAPMRVDLKLCGCMFGLGVKRERWFETSWQAYELRPSCYHPEPVVGVYGHPRGRRSKQGKPWGWGNYSDWCLAMGIDWMRGEELAQAIPPAYTSFIGRQLLEHLSPAPAAITSRSP